MNESRSLVFFYTETPLHAGSGTTLGAVDLPIQRERMSGLPMVPGSGLKGAWREQIRSWCDDRGRDDWEEWGLALFGREPPRPGAEQNAEPPEEFAGAMSLLDARLLLLPVRTVWGGWAWVTSPMVLQRLARDLDVVGEGKVPSWRELRPGEGEARVGTQSAVAKGKSFIVEDFEYQAAQDKEVDHLAGWLAGQALPQGDAYKPFRERLASQLAVVGDEELKFLAEHATEVVARIRISAQTGTVEKHALWSEESLPAESLLWTVAFFTDERRKKDKKDKEDKEDKKYERKDAGSLQKSFVEVAKKVSRIRLGGDRTTGRGVVGVHVRPAGDDKGTAR